MKNKSLKEIIDNSNNIVVMTGAGFSCASGIPDFRSADGIYNTLYKGLKPEYIISHTFFQKDPKEFYNFYINKMIYPNAKPNAGHIALTKLEKKGKLKAIITQNIDGLHQIAGSKNVLELHGSIKRNYCTKCHKFFDEEYIINSKTIPYCDHCKGLIKPDVVLYEEGLDNNLLYRSLNYIENAEVLIVAGTSLLVNPAASLVNYFRGKELVIINYEETPYDKYATLVIHDDIIETLANI